MLDELLNPLPRHSPQRLDVNSHCLCVCAELACLCGCGFDLVLAPHGVTAALHVPVEMLVVWYGLSGKEKATVVVEGGEGEGEGEGH